MRESEALHTQQIKGSQPGDPVKAAAAIIAVAAAPNPPLHLLLGQDAYDMAGVKIKALQDDMAQWKHVTVATGFAEAATA